MYSQLVAAGIRSALHNAMAHYRHVADIPWALITYNLPERGDVGFYEYWDHILRELAEWDRIRQINFPGTEYDHYSHLPRAPQSRAVEWENYVVVLDNTATASVYAYETSHTGGPCVESVRRSS